MKTRYAFVVVGGVLAAWGCEPAHSKTGSETNFLSVCDGTCEDGLSCVCGVCTRACAIDGDCTPLGASAQCVAERDAAFACFAAEDRPFCDLACATDADCAALGEAFGCNSGYCRVGGGSTVVCPTPTLSPGDNDRTVDVGGTSRNYLVRVPANFTGTSPVPLVLDFHTLGGTPTGEETNSGYAELAEREGFIVAYPEGIDGAWNVGPCCTTARDVDDVGFARAVVAQIQTEACIDTSRVYAVGVANGGGMAYHLACNAADAFAGVAASSFDLMVESQQPCQPTQPVTVISFRGTADTLMPYDGGTQQAPNGLDVTLDFMGAVATFERFAELDQCTGAPSTADASGCSTYATCAAGAEVTLCTTEGGAMGWGDPEIAWATLSRHSLP